MDRAGGQTAQPPPRQVTSAPQLSPAGSKPMVTIAVAGEMLTLEVNGFDRLWSLRSRLEVPFAHIRAVQPAPDVARGWFDRLKIAGSYIPGILTAGTFYEDGGLVFWDVHQPHNALAIDLEHERYQRLIVEVADPAETMRLIQHALGARGS